MSQTINLHMILNHIGDCVFVMILFYNIKDYIEKNNIFINFYCLSEFHKQLNEFNVSNNIKLLDYKEEGLNIHPTNNHFDYNFLKNIIGISFNEFYVNFYNNLLKELNINYTLTNLSYKDEDLLVRYNNLNNKYNNELKNIDFLVINSIPFSKQIEYIETDWNNFCIKLNNKYNIITTKKIEGIKCTLDYDLTLKDIASISTNIKNIIGINTGVIVGLFNEYTLTNIDNCYYFDHNVFYSYPKFKKVNNLNDLEFLFNDKLIENFNNNIEISYSYDNYYIFLIIFILIFLFLYYC